MLYVNADVPTGLGTIVGSTIIGKFLNSSYASVEEQYRVDHKMFPDENLSKKSIPIDFPIEHARLAHVPWITLLFTISTSLYGLSFSSTVLLQRPGWVAVPLVLQFLVAATSNAIFAISQTLVSDLCPGKGASSTAISNLVRCSIGAAGVAVLDTMIGRMGVVSVFVGLGLLTVAVYPLSVAQWYWAMEWRAERAGREKL